MWGMSQPVALAPIRVLVVDDHPVFRKGVRALLEGGGDISVIGEAGTGGEGIRQAGALQPDIVIMDLMLPDMTGLEATEQIHETFPTIRVLILTSNNESDALVPALKAGATGYVLKSETRVELVNAVRSIAQGKALVPVEFTADLVNAVQDRDQLHAALTSREMDVLRALARGLNNAQIAARLGIGEGTVKTHISSLLGKLSLADRTLAALYAIKHGLVRPDEIEL
jgi:NarL family two-component system response regulator LiaR